MLKVGITGGIGSGKTTVCKIFETLGISVYYADERAKSLMISDAKLINEICKLFGEDAYTKDGTLNRKWIAAKVFNDKNLLQQLNNIVHPAVFFDTQQWFQAHLDKAYVLYESAIMYESGSSTLLDKIIAISSPIEDRINRTIIRDNIAKEAVLERMDKQLPSEEIIKKADFVIYNDNSHALIEQVLTIHGELISLAQ